jgi:oligosaccharide 4-alpha-D-glucosyltransferase
MRKLLFIFLLQYFFCTAFSQSDYITHKEFVSAGGKFTISHYAENIYKITYTPRGYDKDQNPSDAVILKLHAMIGYPFEARVIHDTVFLKDRPVLTGLHAKEGYHGFYFPLQEDEMIFGAGERALPLNRRGYRLRLYNNPWYGYGEGADQLNYSVPFITSSRGYGLFFDNPSAAYIDIGKADKNILEYGATSGELNVFVIFGDYQQVLRSYHQLTGTQPLPPRWAFGNLMSRFGYTSEAQVKEILAKMDQEKIPVEAVIFDLFWFGDSIKSTMGNLDWVNKAKWPDPKKMIGDLKKQGIRTILVTEPFLWKHQRIIWLRNPICRLTAQAGLIILPISILAGVD